MDYLSVRLVVKSLDQVIMKVRIMVDRVRVREAYESLPDNPKKAEYLLAQALELEDEHEDITKIGNHICKKTISEVHGESYRCIVRGCEFTQYSTPYVVYERVAKNVSCPSIVEQFEHALNSKREMHESWIICTDCADISPPEQLPKESCTGSYLHADDEEDAEEKKERILREANDGS